MNQLFTLLLRLEGPMQSWGCRSRFDHRDTTLEPTRSGVLGLVCAAIGIARGEDISRFDAIRMGVRVDREGRLERDYHTAMKVIKADGSGADTVVSYRDYLADAIFTVGLESSDRSLLEEVEGALRKPKWPLYLGRRAFCLTVPPLSASEPAIIQHSLSEALEGAALSLRCRPRADRLRCRLIIEEKQAERVQDDWPLCFGERRFRPRSIQTSYAEGAWLDG